MKLNAGPSSSIKFCEEIPKGFPLHVPTTPQVLVVEKAVPHWGVLKSIELGVYRDGTIANNIATRNIGIQEKDGAAALIAGSDAFCTSEAQLRPIWRAAAGFGRWPKLGLVLRRGAVESVQSEHAVDGVQF